MHVDKSHGVLIKFLHSKFKTELDYGAFLVSAMSVHLQAIHVLSLRKAYGGNVDLIQSKMRSPAIDQKHYETIEEYGRLISNLARMYYEQSAKDCECCGECAIKEE